MTLRDHHQNITLPPLTPLFSLLISLTHIQGRPISSLASRLSASALSPKAASLQASSLLQRYSGWLYTAVGVAAAYVVW